jgi:hypothetical protein
MSKAFSAAEQIFDDLLTLEINVIIKPGMTARKMPNPAHALLDVIAGYDEFLCRFAAEHNLKWDAAGRPEVVVRAPDPQVVAAGAPAGADGKLADLLREKPLTTGVQVGTFDDLREAAVEAEAMFRTLVIGGWVVDDGQGVILKRIYRNCDQLKGILAKKKLPAAGITRDTPDAGSALSLSPHEVIAVRKIWEVGTEVVLMQTVASLDGDVVTRVQQARVGAANKPLHDLHRESVTAALAHWQFLVQTVTQFVASNASRFLGRS